MTHARPARKMRGMDQPAATLHVFRAGTHTATDGNAYTFSEADIADLVDSYDPAISRARAARSPVVFSTSQVDPSKA